MLRFILSLSLLLLAGSSPARAADSTLLVGLHIQSQRLELAYPNAVRSTSLSRLDLIWHEQLNSWLDGSIRLGKFNLTQDSNPIPAGQAGSGNALGLGLTFHLYRGDRLRLQTDLDYQYADSNAELTGQTVDLRWHQLSGQLRAELRLIRYSYLSLTAGAIAIHGDERASGTITSVQSFHSDRSDYTRLAFVLGLDPASYIGIEVDAGSIAGERLYFQRWF